MGYLEDIPIVKEGSLHLIVRNRTGFLSCHACIIILDAAFGALSKSISSRPNCFAILSKSVFPSGNFPSPKVEIVKDFLRDRFFGDIGADVDSHKNSFSFPCIVPHRYWKATPYYADDSDVSMW